MIYLMTHLKESLDGNIKQKGAEMPIKKTQKGYKIAKTAGYSKTKKDAEKRLKAIKASQKNRRKGQQKRRPSK